MYHIAKTNNRIFKNILIFLCFSIVVFLAFLIRTYDYNREANRIGSFVPFTLESAMMYSYAREIAKNGCLPDKDKKLIGTDDISINRQMSISMEYFLGYGYRLKSLFFPAKKSITSRYGDNSNFSQWARFQIRLWISLSAGLIFLWLLILRCSWIFSILGGLLFAVSPAAIARATGQDLIRENFAVPIILAAFVCYFWYLQKPKKFKLVLFGLAVFGALYSWDMVQLCFSVWGIFEIIRIFINTALKRETDISERTIWLIFFAVSVIAGFSIPYLNEHNFLMSPLVAIILPSVILINLIYGKIPLNLSINSNPPLTPPRRGMKFCLRTGVASGQDDKLNSPPEMGIKPGLDDKLNSPPVRGLRGGFFTGTASKLLLGVSLIIILFCLWFFIFSRFGYAGNYSHFANLIKAKLYFGNIKPINPNLLDFDSRILWTPALHSATKQIFWILFHFVFPVFTLLLGGILLFPKSRKRFLKDFQHLSLPIFFTFFYFILFIFMVRFHALVIPFLSLSVALLFNNVSSIFKNRGRFIFIIIFALLILSEAEWFFQLNRKYNNNGKTNIELIEWFNLNPNIKNKRILAEFTLSPMLKAYTGTKILLQPKFELGKTRNLVKEYLTILYKGDEKELVDFCQKYKIDYFIFNKGLAAGGKKTSIMHPWGNRYMAAAFELKEDSPVYRCYYKPDRLRYFYRLDEVPKYPDLNSLYTVFKVITPEKVKEAKRLYLLAENAFKAKKINKAEKLVKSAILLDPASPQIRYLYYRLFDNKWPYITLNGLTLP